MSFQILGSFNISNLSSKLKKKYTLRKKTIMQHMHAMRCMNALLT